MAWEGASGRREQNHHRYIRMEALSEMMLVQKQGEEAEKTFCSLRQKPGSVSESSGLASVLLAFSRYVFCVSWMLESTQNDSSGRNIYQHHNFNPVARITVQS